MKDRATVSGAHSCLSQSEEHLDLVVLLQALCGFHGGPDEAASSQNSCACHGNVPNSDLPAELKLCAADAGRLSAICEGAVAASGFFT